MSRHRFLAVLAAAGLFACVSSVLSQPAGDPAAVGTAVQNVENENDAEAAPAIVGRAEAERKELLEDLLAAVELALREHPTIQFEQLELEMQLQLLDAATRNGRDADRRRLQADADATKQRIRQSRIHAILDLIQDTDREQPRVKYAQ
jgi:hypothetical protein